MTRRLRWARAPIALLGLALILGACGYGNDDTETLGDNPFVTPEGTPTVFAQFEPGIQVMPMPNDVVWLADGDPEVELAIEENDPLAALKTVVNAQGLLGLSPNMFLTVPVTGAVQAETTQLVAFRTDDPQLPTLLGALAAGNLAAAGAALAQMELRTEADFLPVADGPVLKLLPKFPFTPGAAYAVTLKRTLRDAGGSLLSSSLAMQALKSRTPFGADHPYARLERIRAGFNDANPSTGAPGLLDVVGAVTAVRFGGQSWTRDDVLVAWTFHTAAETLDLPTAPGTAPPALAYADFDAVLQQLRGLSAALPADPALTWLNPATGAPAAEPTGLPASVALAGAGLPDISNLGTLYTGVFQSPVVATGGTTTTTVPFLLLTPAAGAVPFPVVVFQHGITRSKSDVLGMANALAGTGLAVLAIDAPLHGDRTPEGQTSGQSFFTADLLTDRLNIYQAAVDLWETMDLVEGGIDLNPAAADGVDLSPTGVRFAAHSLGSIIGSVFLSQETRAERILLSSPSALLVNVLDETARPDLQGLVGSLGFTKGTTPYYVFLNLAQWLLDPVDSAYTGIGAASTDSLLAVFAQGDPSVTDQSSRLFLTNLGLDVADVVPVDPDDIAAGLFPDPLVDFGAGAYQYGVTGKLVIHSFLLSPLFDPVTEPWYVGYDPADQFNATVGAQTQAAGFLAPAVVIE